MSAEAVKPNPPSIEGERHRQLGQDIRAAITNRLNDLHHVHKPGASGSDMGDEDELGVRIITISGTNTGAILRGELLDHDRKHHGHQEEFPDGDQPQAWDSFVNSNFQAVNNSIMLGATCTSNDPGVHMEIADVMDTPSGRAEKHERRGVKKGKETAQGNLKSQFSQ